MTSPESGRTSVGVPRETVPGERRVALVPGVVERLCAQGLGVVVETCAGQAALIPDEAFTKAGATIGDPWSADVVVKVNAPTEAEIGRLSPGSALLGFLAPLTDPDIAGRLRAAGVLGFALESVPRISRAQSMDALSSQANVSGYRAVLLAASECTRFFPMLTTAAGTVKPASALVLGVGVAGLQALATAKRLGARTTGYDVRPEVADQVRSVGAKWLDLGVSAVGEGGYARELTAAERAEQAHRLNAAIAGFDVVITTALVPGGPDAGPGRRGAPNAAGQRDRRPRGGGRRQLRAQRARQHRGPPRDHHRRPAESSGRDAGARQRALRPERAGTTGADDRRRALRTGLHGRDPGRYLCQPTGPDMTVDDEVRGTRGPVARSRVLLTRPLPGEREEERCSWQIWPFWCWRGSSASR